MTNGDTTINTGGGAATGNVQTSGGDFVGRDQINFIVPLGNWEEVRRLLFKDPARPVTKSIQEQFQSFNWAKAEQAYLDKVIKLYDRVRILGSSADVPLGNLFTQVYILDKPTARYRHDIEELRKRGADRGEFQRQPGKRIKGLDLVKQGQNLFILGKPGAGKTTFLKYITIQAAHKQLARIPIFVSLNQWADSRWGKGDKAALLPFLVEQFDICNFPNADFFLDYLLRAGRALVLFDGLDEVKQEKNQRRHLSYLLQDFAHKYDKSQHLITCRIAASDYAFGNFIDVEIADFTPHQVQEYGRIWFGEQEKKFNAFIGELTKPENQGLAELCNTPLLLSLLCLAFDNLMHFPSSRAELYEDALETLLRKWDSSRQIQRDEIYRTLSYKRKLQLLMSIAKPTFERGELFFRQRDLEQWITNYLVTLPDPPTPDCLDATAILKSIEAQHSIIVERAQSIYSFSHLTFQEYFTARSWIENQSKGIYEKINSDLLTDQRWREVFLLIASLLDNADAFIKAILGAINDIIVGRNALTNLLIWVDERIKAAHIPTKKHTAVRLAYVFLAFSLDMKSERKHALDFLHVRDSAFALDLALNLVFARTRTITLDLARSYTRPLDRSLTRNLIRNFARNCTLASTLVRTVDSQVGFDYALFYSWSYATLFARNQPEHVGKDYQVAIQQFQSFMGDIVILANEMGLDNVAKQLLTLSIPLPNSSTQMWQQYTNALFAIMSDRLSMMYEWVFCQDDINKFNKYLYATELLVQCLNVAVVSDKQSVLQRLLIPPE